MLKNYEFMIISPYTHTILLLCIIREQLFNKLAKIRSQHDSNGDS
jgi:hypothetical protein